MCGCIVEVIYLHYLNSYYVIIVSRKSGVLSFEPVCIFVFSYNVNAMQG